MRWEEEEREEGKWEEKEENVDERMRGKWRGRRHPRSIHVQIQPTASYLVALQLCWLAPGVVC